MTYIMAFLFGGFICLLGQLVFANTNLGPLKIFMKAISLGVILTFFGPMEWIVEKGGAGVITNILDAGEGLFWSFFLMFQGNYEAIISFTIMIVLVLAIGVISGFLTPIAKKDQV